MISERVAQRFVIPDFGPKVEARVFGSLTSYRLQKGNCSIDHGCDLDLAQLSCTSESEDPFDVSPGLSWLLYWPTRVNLGVIHWV